MYVAEGFDDHFASGAEPATEAGLQPQGRNPPWVVESMAPGAPDLWPAIDCPEQTCMRETLSRIEQGKREWEATVDALPQLVVLLDHGGEVLRANRVVEHWGLGSVAQCIGRSVHQLLHPHCVDSACHFVNFWRDVQPMLAQGHNVACETEDKQLARHLRIRVSPICIAYGDDRGIPQGSAVVIVLEDITKLKHVEAELRTVNERLEERVAARTADLEALNKCLLRSVQERARVVREQRRLIAILEGTSDLVGISDPGGRLIYLNAAGRCMLGLGERDDVARLHVRDCHPLPVVEHLMTSAIPVAIRDGVWAGESILRTGAGQDIPVLQVIIAHLDASGAVDRLSTIIRDISEQRGAMEALRESRNELRLLSAQLLTYQEKERQRIASELHDGLGQTLSAVKFCVEDGLRRMAEGCPDDASRVLQHVVGKVQGAVEEVRRISMDLRPSTLDDLGIVPTLAWFFREFEAIYRDIHVVKQIEIEEGTVVAPVKTAIYRVVQEAMHNVAKHAGAGTIRVALLRVGNLVDLTIADDGCGFDGCKLDDCSGRGFGLTGMRERTALSGGTFRIESESGVGTRIRACWPAHACVSNASQERYWTKTVLPAMWISSMVNLHTDTLPEGESAAAILHCYMSVAFQFVNSVI